MPKWSKQALSRYIRTGCDRQLRLTIATDTERSIESMPGEQPPRPGLQDAVREGLRWQHEKVTDLVNTFGTAAVIANASQTKSGVQYSPIDLDPSLTQSVAVVPATQPSVWLVEPQFGIGPAFETALGIAGLRTGSSVTYADLRPDLLEVRPASGTAEFEVTPDGDTRPIAAGDTRLRVRIIDVKLTAEPSPGYFAEVTLYSMALAGWLQDRGRDDEFVVTTDAALWPGSHDASKLATTVDAIRRSGATPTADEMRAALAEDLESVPFEVFVPEVRRFFTETLPRVLAKPWTDTEYHVDNRCKSCPFLGAPWVDAQGNPTAEPGHCMKVARADGHLSKVAFVSRGARTALERAGVQDVTSLAGRSPSDPALNDHHVLRGSRTVVHERASVLDAQRPAGIAPQSGTSAVMPRWADLRVHVSVDFDASSAITVAFAVSAFWLEPVPYGGAPAGPQRAHQAWPTRVLVVDQRSVAAERRELLAFLAHLDSIFSTARSRNPDSTFQVYVWDQLQLKHLGRVIGRHLPAILADASVRDLAWLFPSDELVPDPKALSRRSPITVLRDVVRAMVAAPVNHYYSLLELAREYHPPSLDPKLARFSVHPLFEDPLSDQIPSERAHEVWSRSANPRRPWMQQMQTLERTVKTRLMAAEQVRRRLEDDLKGELNSTAPKIRVGAMQPIAGISQMSQLWIAHAKIDAAFGALEVAQVRAMPPHERESKFRAARLERLLTGNDRSRALAQTGATGVRPSDLVYRMRTESREVKLREGDFGIALAPESMPGLLDQRLSRVIDGTPLTGLTTWGKDPLMEKVLGMMVVTIDRDALVIVLRPDEFWSSTILGQPDLLEQLQKHTAIDLSSACILDPVYNNFFIRKLEETLKAIKNPPAAANASSAELAAVLGDSRPRGPRRTAHVPAADLLWDPVTMHVMPVARNVTAARQRLEAAGVTLNQSQWSAWQAALTRRLQPIWGPPGTGKSMTLRAIALGACVEAHDGGRPLRMLIGTSNYTALDNVLAEVAIQLPALLGPAADLEIHRLRSTFQEARTAARDIEVEGANLSQDAMDVVARLQSRSGVTVVGATPEQLYNILVGGTGSPMSEAFDLLLLDEASQTDVAHATLFAAAMAIGASVVPAGDTRQLPPITQAQAPMKLEGLVGPFLGLLEDVYGIAPLALDINYRSNAEIVALAHVAGYDPTLRAASPDLRLDLAPASAGPPAQWPSHLVYSPEWDALLDPDHPVTAFIYDDANWSSQWNGFEAQAVAALLCALYPRMQSDLLNELDGNGNPLPRGPRRQIDTDDFWTRGVGVVTPHRAQQALVLTELERAFPGARSDLLRAAVDTVERFQGQQRDVIVVSYALGDPDAIAEEDEFLMNFNRFNVAASRARAKLIVLVSQQVISHLSGEVEVLHDSKLLKQFATTFCSASSPADLPYRSGSTASTVRGRRLWRP